MPNNATMNFTRENFEYNAITGEVIYIDQDGIRKNITLNAVIIANYSELKRIHSPKYNAVYIDNESKKVYAFNATGWIELFTHAEVQKVISHLDDLTPSILTDEHGNYLAPATTVGNIYSDHRYDMYEFLNDDNGDYLRKLHSKYEYVMIEVDGQRVINIPYPYSNYDHRTNYMNVIIDNKVISPADYIISDDQIILTPRKYNLRKGQLVLFTFLYSVLYNLNEKVIIHSQNIANHSITTDKLHPNILIKANSILESTSRVWFTPEERQKLRGLNPYNYEHPATHPASMITETDDRRWVSPDDIRRWDNKANKEDVFTKEETERKFGEWAGSADLAVFRQFAAALDSDPNFATTILRKLSEKTNDKDFKALQAIVEEKVNVKDYVRSDIYDLGTKVTSDETDLYTMRLADGTFGEYVDGMSVVMKVGETNKYKAKLRINDLDYKPILNSDKFELIEGELKRDSIYHLRYNGTTGNFILQGKGGVKITDCSLTKYKAGQDSIIGRGNPIDIDLWDNTISKSRHKIHPICKLNTTISGLKKDETNVFVDLVERKTVFTVWQDGGKVYGATYNVSHGYIENSTTNTYSLLHDKVDTFAVCKVASGMYAIAFAKGDNIIIKVIPIERGKITLGELEGTIIKSTGQIKKPIYFEACGLDKFILIYSHSNVTETHMFSFDITEKKIKTVSKRNNLDYPIDVCQRINKNQLVFAGNYLNSIIGWVLTVDDNDFANSETTRLAQISDTTKVYSNIKLFPLVKDRALIEYNIDDARCKKILNIHYNGDIRITEDSVYSENENEKKHNSNILKRAYVVNMDGFISASNYDAELESATGDGTTIKILLQREGNNGLMYTTDSDNQFLLSETMFTHDIKVYNETCIIAYVSTLGVLKLALFRIERQPNGLAIENANQGEICKFYKF